MRRAVGAGVDHRLFPGFGGARLRHLRADLAHRQRRVGIIVMADQPGRKIGNIEHFHAEAFDHLAVLFVARIDRAEAAVALDAGRHLQGAVALGDIDREMRRIEPLHLVLEHRQVDIRRRQHDIAQLAMQIGRAGQGRFAQGLHRQPGAHGMGENVDAANARRHRQVFKQLQIGVARGGGAFLVGAIGQQRRLGRPGEQHRHAAELPVDHDLRQPEARLFQRGVEAMHINQHIAIDADAARHMRRDLGAEGLLLQRAMIGDHEMMGGVRRAKYRLFHCARLMTGRHGDEIERITRLPARRELGRVHPVPAGGNDEDRRRMSGRIGPAAEQANAVRNPFRHAGADISARFRDADGAASGQAGRKRQGKAAKQPGGAQIHINHVGPKVFGMAGDRQKGRRHAQNQRRLNKT